VPKLVDRRGDNNVFELSKNAQQLAAEGLVDSGVVEHIEWRFASEDVPSAQPLG
jgi:hypothetical protein